jgi:Tfp pilus assembly protein PilO
MTRTNPITILAIMAMILIILMTFNKYSFKNMASLIKKERKKENSLKQQP